MTKRLGGRRAPTAPVVRLTARPDELQTRAPLFQAASQMDAGYAGERGPKQGRLYWDGCPTLKPVPVDCGDLTGLRLHRMVVVGMLDMSELPKAAATGARWVVRCDCGRYETRRGKALTGVLSGAMPSSSMRCERCDYVVHLRKRTYFDQHGRWPDDHYGE